MEPKSKNEGLVFQRDIPATPEEFVAKSLALGWSVERSSRFGFRPEVDRSGTVPIAEPGASIVGVARMMREIREGKRPMPHGATGEAAELLARIEARRERLRSPSL